MLERLTEEWSEATTDASLLSELEFEKQLWMLAALHPPDKKMLSRAMTDDRKLSASPCSGRKILSLYEDHGTSSQILLIRQSVLAHKHGTEFVSSPLAFSRSALSGQRLTHF